MYQSFSNLPISYWAIHYHIPFMLQPPLSLIVNLISLVFDLLALSWSTTPAQSAFSTMGSWDCYFPLLTGFVCFSPVVISRTHSLWRYIRAPNSNSFGGFHSAWRVPTTASLSQHLYGHFLAALDVPFKKRLTLLLTSTIGMWSLALAFSAKWLRLSSPVGPLRPLVHFR